MLIGKAGPLGAASAGEEEWESIRLAARCMFGEPMNIEVNGAAALLVDVSTNGCQLLLPAVVKRNQVVKVLLPSEGTPIACAGKVAWTRVEPAQAGHPVSYRAGVAFTDVDDAAIEAFMAAHTE